MSDKYDGLPPAMAEILKQDDVIKDLRHQLQQAEARIAIEEATTPQPAGDWMRCPECGSEALSWSAHATVTNGTPDGRLRANEVSTLFVLGCNYCSETIETLTSDEVAWRLSETSQPTQQWTPFGIEYNRAIHHNPDAKAWADLFMQTFPHCGADPETMHGWFANAMMAMHDHLKSKQPAQQGSVPEEIIKRCEEAIEYASEIRGGCISGVREGQKRVRAILTYSPTPEPEQSGEWVHDQRLKRCPFCGGPCKTIKGQATNDVWPHGKFWRVYCVKCQCRQLFHKTEAAAIGAWNHRVRQEGE